MERVKPTYDSRIKMLIDLNDVPFIDRTCRVFGVKFETVATQGQPYAFSGDDPVFVPQGLAWIKMRADLQAGQGFDFVTDIAKDLRAFEEKNR